MPIITENIEGEFARAKEGQAGGQNLVERRLPSLKNAYVPSKGGRLYSEQMQRKTAAVLGGSPTVGGANVLTSSPEIRNPLLNLINFYLPYDRKTLNQWIRYYDRFQPYVGNCIDIHGEFPISDFHFTNIKKDQQVENILEEQKESADILPWMFEASREYELIGEAHSFWAFDEEEGMFLTPTPINPDLLEIKEVNWGAGRHAIYTYEAPQELKDLLHQNDAETADLINEIDPILRENIEGGKRIPLDEFNVISLIRKSSPYESRGTSIVLRIIKELMYEDKMREAQYAIADQQITPVQLWKIGDATAGYMPTAEDLQDFRQLLLAGRHDFLFTIVSHGAVQLDLIGYTGKLLPIIPEMEWVAKRVMVGLFTNEAMVTGDGPTYSNAVVAMKVLQGRYQSKRDKLVKVLKRKIFEPLAAHHELYDTSTADLAHRVRTKRKLMVPDIEWNFKLDLTDESQRINYLMQLREKSELPMETICDVLHLDYAKIKSGLKAEEGTVFDKVYKDARTAKAKDTGEVPDTDLGGIGGGPEPDVSGAGAEAPPEENAPAAPPGGEEATGGELPQ